MLASDIELVQSSEDSTTTESNTKVDKIKQMHIRPINTITLDHFFTSNRDSTPSQNDICSVEEYAKLSFGSETTDDSHLQQLSLPNSEDGLSAVLSEESDCTAAIRVYDLNKRVTKILRHNIIKRSRNPIGADIYRNSFDCFDNCCSDTNSFLESKIKQFTRIYENINQTQGPKQLPSRLTSIHLNRNPRKLKISDMRMLNDVNDENKLLDYNFSRNPTADIFEEEMIQLNVAKTKNIAKQDIDEEDVQQNINEMKTDDLGDNRFDENTGNIPRNERFHNLIEENEEQMSATEVTNEQGENHLIELQSAIQVSYDRQRNIALEMDKNSEKSAIERDVVLVLPSVKALAETFSLKEKAYKGPGVIDGTKVKVYAYNIHLIIHNGN